MKQINYIKFSCKKNTVSHCLKEGNYERKKSGQGENIKMLFTVAASTLNVCFAKI